MCSGPLPPHHYNCQSSLSILGHSARYGPPPSFPHPLRHDNNIAMCFVRHLTSPDPTLFLDRQSRHKCVIMTRLRHILCYNRYYHQRRFIVNSISSHYIISYHIHHKQHVALEFLRVVPTLRNDRSGARTKQPPHNKINRQAQVWELGNTVQATHQWTAYRWLVIQWLSHQWLAMQVVLWMVASRSGPCMFHGLGQ